MMIYHLLHELVHINLINDEVFLLRKKVKLLKPGHTGLEIIVSLVVKHILAEIWNEDKIKEIIEKDIKTHKAHKRMWAKAENLSWDLSKTSLKKYLEKV
jgi:anaerobic ribonucleoside-triphosphate reductase